MHFGLAEGLPSTVVNSITRARDGTPWVSTDAGPSWYDGYRWRLIADTTGRVLRGRQAGVIIAAEDGAVLFPFGPDLWRVARAGAAAHVVPRPSTESVWMGMAVAETGEIWGVFVTKAGLQLARRAGNAWHRESWPGPVPRYSFDFHLQQGPAGAVMLSLGLATWTRRDGTWTPLPPFVGGTGTITLAMSNIEGEERLVVRTADARQGVWARGPRSGANWRKLSFIAGEVPAVLALSSTADALAVLDVGDLVFADSTGWHPLSVPAFVAPVSDAVFDGAGDVWLATRDGVVLWRRSSERWSQWRIPGSSTINRVNALAVSDDGQVVAATAGGVALLRPSGELQLLFTLPGVAFTSVAWGRDGELWAGSGGHVGGVYQRTAAGWRHRIDAPGLEKAGIHRIVRGPDGSHWFLGLPLGRDGRGGVWHATNGRVEAVPLPPNVVGARFYDMVQDSSGRRWYATDRGLLRESAGRIEFVPPVAGRAGQVVFSLAVADRGAIWVSLRPSGVVRLLPDLRAELPDTGGPAPTGQVTVHSSADGRLWATNADGIWLRVGTTWSKLDRSFGLPTLNIWPLVSSRDDLYVGTMGAGVLRVRLGEVMAVRPRVIPQPPRLDDGALTLRWQLATERGIVAPTDIASRWRLDDGAWSAWSTQTEVQPPAHVPWRRHVLWVEARTALGVTSVAPERIAFAVPAPGWWRRDVLAVIGGMLVLLAWLSVLLVRRRRGQEQMARRMREAERMELVGTFAAEIAHELNNLLTTITINADLVEDAEGFESPSPSSEIRRAALQAGVQLRQVLSFTSDMSRVVSLTDLTDVLRAQQRPLAAFVGEHIELRWELPDEAVPVIVEPNAIAAVLRTLVEQVRYQLHGAGTIDIVLCVVPLDEPLRARLDLRPATQYAEIRISAARKASRLEELPDGRDAGAVHGGHTVASLALVRGLLRRFGGALHMELADGAPPALSLYLAVAESAAGTAPAVAATR